MLPKDPIILLSYMNTQLRDNYSSLEALADGLDLSQDEINSAVATLKAAGYEYSNTQNKFI